MNDAVETEQEKPARVGASDVDCLVMCPQRIDYIKRLIAGVRQEAEKDIAESGIRDRFEDEEIVCSGKFLDAMLLCDVIEKEVLRTTGT
jgi:hypothetical protein